MSEWISVEDRLPETYVDGVLVWNDYLVVVEAKYPLKGVSFRGVEVAGYSEEGGDIDGKWTIQTDDLLYESFEECHVTHWMPLPEPPGDG